MEDKHEGRPNVYQRRLRKELATPEEEIQRRMCWDIPVLSSNHKCSVSLDLPVLNCMPTKVCAGVCYASQGRQSYRRSLVKSLAINRMIDQDPERFAQVAIDEAAGRSTRLAGSGDLLPKHRTLIDHIERLRGSWYGFTSP